jgi:CRP/FNR family transcriptional regulator, nitrogen oxide reductase regulator
MSCACEVLPGKQIAGLPHKLRPRFLAGLSKAELGHVLSLAKHRQFRASSVVIQQGEPATRFFVLTSGQGRHFVTTDDGRKILLYWLTAGQVFGGTSILSVPFQYLASTELLTDSCALMWDRQTIREMVLRYPVLLDNAVSIAVTEYAAWFVAAQISLSSEDARGRTAHMLVSLSCGIGKATADGIELKIKNEDLAAGANVTPFTVSRILNEWQRAGVLTKVRGKLLLRKPLLLAAELNSSTPLPRR